MSVNGLRRQWSSTVETLGEHFCSFSPVYPVALSVGTWLYGFVTLFLELWLDVLFACGGCEICVRLLGQTVESSTRWRRLGGLRSR